MYGVTVTMTAGLTVISTVKSISSGVLYLDRLKRIDPWAAVKGTPMARSTCEGSREPEVQAEPDEAQIPYSFIMSRMASPSMYSKERFTVLGRR